MKTFFASIICIGLFGSTLAQYGIPDDEEDGLPPSTQQQEIRLPVAVSRFQTTSAPRSYTKYEDEEPLAMHKYSPIYTARRNRPVAVNTQPIVIKTAVQPATVEIRKENVQYEQPAVIAVKATEKPVIKLLVSPAITPTTSTQIRFADGDYSSSDRSIREENIRYEQPAIIAVKATEKPVIKYSAPPAITPTTSTQIRFADDDYSSSGRSTRQENVRYEQPALTTFRATEKPVVVYSAPSSTVSTQIRFANNDYSSSSPGYSSTKVQSDVVPIVKYVMDSDHLGTFHLETLTGDGTSNTVTGKLKDFGGSEGPVVVKTGSYRFTGDNGKVYKVDWTADEKGFKASGDHINN